MHARPNQQYPAAAANAQAIGQMRRIIPLCCAIRGTPVRQPLDRERPTTSHARRRALSELAEGRAAHRRGHRRRAVHDLAITIRAAGAAEGGARMMEQELITASELQMLPSCEAKSAATRRQKVARFVKKHALKTIRVGEHGERQFEFADLFQRLPEVDRAALIRMRKARTAPAASPTPAVVAAASAEELSALEENWEGASDKCRARAERLLSYVRELWEELQQPYNERDLNRACKTIAARRAIGWFTVRRAAIKVKNRPAELWAFLLVDKNRGRSRHEYGREWDRYFRSYYLVRTAPAASVCRDLACRSIAKMDVDAARRAGIRVPTAKALLDRLHAELSDEAILLARCGADAVAARHYQDRDYSSLAAGEALNGDGHRCDRFVKWPDGYRRPADAVRISMFDAPARSPVTGSIATENQDLVQAHRIRIFPKSFTSRHVSRQRARQCQQVVNRRCRSGLAVSASR